MLDLLTADYTFVNQRVAEAYGISNVAGPAFRMVSHTDPRRRGVFGHGSVLLQTSVADRTSPVLRGKWIMEVLLGSPPPPPPPNIPALEETKGTNDAGRTLTVRERMEGHRRNPNCNSCHQFIDPLGLALEAFDVMGRTRIKDGDAAVDSAARLWDGTELTGAADLASALNRYSEPILRNFTENLLVFALGRRIEFYDQPTVRAITRKASSEGNRFASFVLGVVGSAPFQQSTSASTDAP